MEGRPYRRAPPSPNEILSNDQHLLAPIGATAPHRLDFGCRGGDEKSRSGRFLSVVGLSAHIAVRRRQAGRTSMRVRPAAHLSAIRIRPERRPGAPCTDEATGIDAHHPSALSPWPCFAPPCGSVASSPEASPLAWPCGVSRGRLGASPGWSDGFWREGVCGGVVVSVIVTSWKATRPAPAKFVDLLRRTEDGATGGAYRKRARIVSSLRHSV